MSNDVLRLEPLGLARYIGLYILPRCVCALLVDFCFCFNDNLLKVSSNTGYKYSFPHRLFHFPFGVS